MSKAKQRRLSAKQRRAAERAAVCKVVNDYGPGRVLRYEVELIGPTAVCGGGSVGGHAIRVIA